MGEGKGTPEPIARNVLDALAPPIMAFSTGIATIGEALARLDSPATRAIGSVLKRTAALSAASPSSCRRTKRL